MDMWLRKVQAGQVIPPFVSSDVFGLSAGGAGVPVLVEGDEELERGVVKPTPHRPHFVVPGFGVDPLEVIGLTKPHTPHVQPVCTSSLPMTVPSSGCRPRKSVIFGEDRMKPV